MCFVPVAWSPSMVLTNTVDFDAKQLIPLIEQYKSDPESVYNTWFAGGEERLKAFRAIRIGVRDTFSAIAAGTFGNDFKDSPLEVVLTAITEQKQVFEGAAHAFYWKPKMRIPDIYENSDNKRKFGEFLESCYSASREDQVLDHMSRLAAAEIKGLGPAAANIIYFLHPTLYPSGEVHLESGKGSRDNDRQQKRLLWQRKINETDRKSNIGGKLLADMPQVECKLASFAVKRAATRTSSTGGDGS